MNFRARHTIALLFLAFIVSCSEKGVRRDVKFYNNAYGHSSVTDVAVILTTDSQIILADEHINTTESNFIINNIRRLYHDTSKHTDYFISQEVHLKPGVYELIVIYTGIKSTTNESTGKKIHIKLKSKSYLKIHASLKKGYIYKLESNITGIPVSMRTKRFSHVLEDLDVNWSPVVTELGPVEAWVNENPSRIGRHATWDNFRE